MAGRLRLNAVTWSTGSRAASTGGTALVWKPCVNLTRLHDVCAPDRMGRRPGMGRRPVRVANRVATRHLDDGPDDPILAQGRATAVQTQRLVRVCAAAVADCVGVCWRASGGVQRRAPGFGRRLPALRSYALGRRRSAYQVDPKRLPGRLVQKPPEHAFAAPLRPPHMRVWLGTEDSICCPYFVRRSVRPPSASFLSVVRPGSGSIS